MSENLYILKWVLQTHGNFQYCFNANPVGPSSCKWCSILSDCVLLSDIVLALWDFFFPLTLAWCVVFGSQCGSYTCIICLNCLLVWLLLLIIGLHSVLWEQMSVLLITCCGLWKSFKWQIDHLSAVVMPCSDMEFLKYFIILWQLLTAHTRGSCCIIRNQSCPKRQSAAPVEWHISFHNGSLTTQ